MLGQVLRHQGNALVGQAGRGNAMKRMELRDSCAQASRIEPDGEFYAVKSGLHDNEAV